MIFIELFFTFFKIGLFTVGGGYTGKVSEKTKSVLEDFIGKNYPEISEKYKIDRCYMPWNRMFEVGLTVERRTEE